MVDHRWPLRPALCQLGLSAPVAFLAGLLVGVLNNGLYEFARESLAEQFGIKSPKWAALITAGVVLLVLAGLLVAAALVLRRAARPTAWNPRSGDRLAPKKRGLILLVSNEKSAAFAIKHHFLGGPLEVVWLVGTNDAAAAEFGRGTRTLADRVGDQARALAQNADRALDVIVPEPGVSAADAHDTFDLVRRIYRQRRLPPEDVIADFTGGTKPMAVGLILASLARDRSLEYVSLHGPTNTMHGPFLIDYRHELFDLPGD